MITGDLLIKGSRFSRPHRHIVANALTGAPLDGAFSRASAQDVRHACQAASEAFEEFRNSPLMARGDFLERVAQELELAMPRLSRRASEESGTTVEQIRTELMKCSAHYRAFGEFLHRAHFSLPKRSSPTHRSSERTWIRERQAPLGPVAVFGADSCVFAAASVTENAAAALAAGCTVVLRAHPTMAGTSELFFHAVHRALVACGMPAGTYSLIGGDDPAIDACLIGDSAISAVAFIGTREERERITGWATRRPTPIPVFSEMRVQNPNFLLPGYLGRDPLTLGRLMIGSIRESGARPSTVSSLLFAADIDALEPFIESARSALLQVPAKNFRLSQDAHAGFEQHVAKLLALPGVSLAARGDESLKDRCIPVFLLTDAKTFLETPVLHEEIVGPCCLIVTFQSAAEMQALAHGLDGQKSVGVEFHGNEDELLVRGLIPILERKAGRILANQWPGTDQDDDTSVEQSNGASMSRAADRNETVERYLRPVPYSNVPDSLLP